MKIADVQFGVLAGLKINILKQTVVPQGGRTSGKDEIFLVFDFANL